MGSLIDLTGQRFGRLTVTGRSSTLPTDKGKVYWDCVCDCGNPARVEGWTLRHSKVQSCGCFFHDRITKHGDYKDRIYRVWGSMKARCQNKNSSGYRYYGAKGIKVCDEWLDYSTFKKWAIENGYEPGLTIDRIDSNKDYCPENCQWITQSENSKRTARNLLTVCGETRSLREWQRRIGVGDMCIEHWVERNGKEYAERKIDATLHPEKYTAKELDELGIYKNKRRYATINGETLSFTGWGKRIGMSHTGIRYLLKKYGEEYTIERIKSELSR